MYQGYVNGLVSQRDQEKYFFKLQDLTKIQEMFDDMIGTVSILHTKVTLLYLFNHLYFVHVFCGTKEREMTSL